MAMPTKTPVREAIEAEVLNALLVATRPLSAQEIYARTQTADDKQQVVRIIGHMREAGTIVRDADIQVGEPGGMSPKTKGARAVSSYRLLTAAELDAIDATAIEDAYSEKENGSALSAETREEDPADYPDTAASAANGDESASPWARMLADGCEEDHQWESDLLQACETSRESLLTIADQLLAGHPIWIAARAVDRALTRLADEYV